MIGKLTGLVDWLGEDRAIIDVSGVGYLVFCSGRTLGRLGGQGQPALLWIDTHVREDHIHLYGFAERAEQEWFRLLSSVQGVGARMAMAILTVLAPEELVRAIASQDKTALTRASGVGPKLAGRITSELKDKVGAVDWGAGGVHEALSGATAGGAAAGGKKAGGVNEDAVSALVNLGYKRAEAFGAVARAAGALGDEAALEDLIRQGLKELTS